MYVLTLYLHSYVRWLVLIAALVVLVRALRGWLGRRDWTAADDRAGQLFTVTMDVQVLLGLALYVGLSPLVAAALRTMATTMRDSALRFFAVEHIAAMVVALVLAHVGRARSRRAADALARHRRAAIWYGLSILLMLVSIPWPFYRYGRALFRLP